MSKKSEYIKRTVKLCMLCWFKPYCHISRNIAKSADVVVPLKQAA